MALAANHAAMAAPMQGLTEISLGIPLVLAAETRPAGLVAFLFLSSLWISEGEHRGFGSCWFRCWHRLRSQSGGPGSRAWGVDALLARRWPSSPWW
jgi:hypothetical protein